MEQWVGRLAVVTGASGGVGAVIAEKLVRAGINVVGIARRVERVQELSEKLSEENTAKLHPVQCDLADEQQILVTFKWIEETLGAISILINNAGVMCSTTLSDGNIEMWKKTFDINVLAYCICAREAIAIMKKQAIDGVIINVGGRTGRHVPEMPSTDYGFNVFPASKSAVNAITDMLRAELRLEQSRIKIMCLSPGLCSTDLYSKFPEEECERLARLPILYPADVGNAVMYLLSTPSNILVQDLVIKPWS